MPCLSPLDLDDSRWKCLHICYLQNQEPLSVCKAIKCCPFGFHICYLLHQVSHQHTRTHAHNMNTHTHRHTQRHTHTQTHTHTHTHTHTLLFITATHF